MSMNNPNPSRTLVEVCPRRFRDVTPSAAAEAELRWFFNEAEAEIDMPSNYCSLLAGVRRTTEEEVERRIEAQHAAGKINGWLKSLHTTQALLLAGLYTERPWSDEVTKALPHGLAGAAEASPIVKVEYLRAIARNQTRARTIADWIEGVVHKGRRDLVDVWRAELELSCALAVRAYDRARGNRPCAVPHDEEES
ncbi:MAG TPA: hypothetical protein VMU96_10095 [Casimicrobiaceae bacterium]|nr:hypothetical protein [Casimicrobiaceae bacterium]